MNILYLISYAGKAGTEKYVETLMEQYTAAGHSCHLVCCTPGELSERAEARGWPVQRMELGRAHILSAARALGAYCRENGIELIHAQYPRENVIAVLARRYAPGVRVVFTSHLTVRQGLLWRSLNRLITPRDSAVITVCAEGEELLRKNGVEPSRIRVQFNGVSVRPLPMRENRIREEWKIPADAFVFMTMARLAPEKGIFFLLDSLAILKERSEKPFVCLIAGDGELMEPIREGIAEKSLTDNVILAGYRADAAALLPSADAYICSSLRNEAMSFAILEAMECALPLAVTDVGAGRTLAEGCGFVCAPGDSGAMCENLRNLMENEALCRKLGEHARKRVETEFSVEALTRGTMRIYRDEA